MSKRYYVTREKLHYIGLITVITDNLYYTSKCIDKLKENIKYVKFRYYSHKSLSVC